MSAIAVNNFRALRRFLQGKGVNLRENFATVDVYSGVAIPGMDKDDIIISVLNMTDLTDVGSQINRAVKASREFGSANSRITFTARVAGASGNKIRVSYVNDQVQFESGVAQPAIVNVVNTESGGVIYTDIVVHMALNTSGTVDTTDTTGGNTANAIRAAVLTQADAPGHPRAADIVDVTIANGSGVTHVTAMAATVLQNGADDSQHGATADTLTDAEGLVWTERFPRDDDPDGRVIRVAYDGTTQLGLFSKDPYVTVTVDSSNRVVITIVLGTDDAGALNTTRNQVAQMVMDSYRQRTSAVGDSGVAGGPQGAADFVSVAYPNDTTVCANHAASSLTGGSTNGGFVLATTPEDVTGDVVKVLWLTAR